jgi:hypothetical protein
MSCLALSRGGCRGAALKLGCEPLKRKRAPAEGGRACP